MTTLIKHGLALRLAVHTASVALVLAFVMSFINIHFSLQKLKEQQSSVINSILATTLPSFNLATFNYNLPLNQELTEGLVSHPDIVSAVVLDSSGLQLAQAGKSQSCDPGTLSLLLFNDPGLFIHSLSYNNLPLGKLVVELDRCQALDEFRQTVLLEIIHAVFFALLIALFIYTRFYYRITRPLTQLVRQIESINPATLEQTDLRQFHTRRQDELGVLINQFSHLLHILRQDQEQQRRSEATINDYSQKLEELISKRTHALTHLNRRLQQTQDDQQDTSPLQQRLSTLMQLLEQPLQQLIGSLDGQHPDDARNMATYLRQLVNDLQVVQENACHKNTGLIDLNALLANLLNNPQTAQSDISYICDIREDIIAPPACLTLLLKGLISNALLRRGNKNLLLHIRPGGQQLHISLSGKGLSLSNHDFSQDLLPLQPSTLHLPSALGLALLRDLCQLLGGELQLSTFDLHGQTLTCLLPLRTRRQLLNEAQHYCRQQPLALQINNDLYRQTVRQWLQQWQLPYSENSAGEHQILLTDHPQANHPAELTLNIPLADRPWPDESGYLLALNKMISRRPGTERAPLRVLLVDDNTINRMLCQRYLKNLAIDPDVADNGLHAIDLTQRKRYDLILMDCQMPVMDGFEATRQIRRGSLNQSTPIIALTGLSGDNERQNCLTAGMNDFISKPFSQDQIQAALIQWINQYGDHASD